MRSRITLFSFMSKLCLWLCVTGASCTSGLNTTDTYSISSVSILDFPEEMSISFYICFLAYLASVHAKSLTSCDQDTSYKYFSTRTSYHLIGNSTNFDQYIKPGIFVIFMIKTWFSNRFKLNRMETSWFVASVETRWEVSRDRRHWSHEQFYLQISESCFE